MVLARLALLGICLLLPQTLLAVPVQDPHINWRETNTDHFTVYYPERLGIFASQVTLAVENAWQQLTDTYALALPDRTSITIWDVDENSNGSALSIRNQVNLYGTTDEILLRGRHPWVANVVAHEFSHIFSLWDARVFRRQVPGISVGGIAKWERWSNRRGFHKLGATAYLPSENIPRWFSEGIAQFDATRLGYDGYDSVRSMVLRSALLADSAVPWGSLHTTKGKSQVGAELVYNQGYAFLLWLADSYSDASLAQLARAAYHEQTLNFDRLFETVYGAPLDDTYNHWLSSARQAAYELAQKRRPEWANAITTAYSDEASSAALALGRFTTVADRNDRGHWFAVGSGSSEYNLRNLYVSTATDAVPDADTFDVVAENVLGTPAWTGDSVVYCKSNPNHFTGYAFARLYSYNTEARQEIELAEVRCKDLTANKTKIVATVRRNNTRNLSVADLHSADKMISLTDLVPPQAAHKPFLAEDGWVYFELQSGHESDLARVHIDTPGKIEIMPLPGSVDSAPVVADQLLVFTSDIDEGISDLWSVPVSGGTSQRITRSLGGFLRPIVHANQIYGIEYHHESFALHAVSAETSYATGPELTWSSWQDDGSVSANSLESNRKRFRFTKPLIVPEFLYQGNAQAGFDFVLADAIGLWDFELEFLVGREFDLSSQMNYDGWWFPISLSYDYYGRNRAIASDDLFPGIGFSADIWFPTAYHAFGLDTRFKVHKDVWLLTGVSGAWFEAHNVYTKFPNDDPYRNLDLWLQMSYNNIPPASDADVNPRGGNMVSSWLRWGHTWPSRFFDDFWRKYQFGTAGANLRNYAALGDHWTLETGFQSAAVFGQAGLKDVNSFDELFLGGEYFSLRRGIFQSYKSFAGYDEFAVAGELSAVLDVLLRWELGRNLGKAGPLLLDGLYLEFGSGIGRAWAADGRKSGPGFFVSPQNLLLDDRAKLDGGLLAESSIALRAKMSLFGGFPWNSFVKVARGWQDPRMFGYYVENQELPDGSLQPVVRQGPKPRIPFRLYIGIGTGF